MQLAPKLLPFWYEPEFQTGQPPFVRFKLRPLTQQEMIDVEELYIEGRPGELVSTRAAQFKAAMLSITAVENLIDDAGEPVAWPAGINRPGKNGAQLRKLIAQAGLRIICEMNGGDWKRFIEAESEAEKNQQPAEADPTKT